MKIQRKIAATTASRKRRSASSKRDLVTVEQCTLKIMANREHAGSADIIIERNGEELFRSNEDYFWVIRFCSPTIGETIASSIFRIKK